ncbi:unnamed protein product [Rotaria magnacalcarata]|uniref:AMP-dependent synthetase/ligase domain-containing protein n=1 Tax=Rotaria magnacalcarata TaxID=392030 RepID=A0A816LVH1_9BILA|nr:unnamed protein product [Rotaria magnacalcarata]
MSFPTALSGAAVGVVNTNSFLEGAQTSLIHEHKTLRELLISILDNDEEGPRVCATFGPHTLSVEQLLQRARRVTTALTSYDRVAICMPPSLEFIVTLCVIILRGIPQVPLIITDNTLQIDRHSSFIATKTLTYSQLCDVVTNMDNNTMGEINGVQLPHRALINRLYWQWSKFSFENRKVCCLKTSNSFGDYIVEIFAPLLHRIPIVILPKSLLLNIDQLISFLASEHVTRIVLIPSLLSVLLNHLQKRKMNLLDLNFVICSDETLSLNLIESFFARKHQFSPTCCLFNLYGSTEVMADVSCQIFNSTNHLYDLLSVEGHVSIGSSIDNIRIEIIEPDERGVDELVVTGDGVANGYHNKNTINDTTLAKQLFVVIMVDLVSTQVKIAGNRVDLTKIEFTLKQHYRVSLAKYLPFYAVPTRCITVAKFPLIISVKIDRQKLSSSLDVIGETQVEQEEAGKDRGFFRVLNEIGIPRAHIDRSFFAAGGSSLNALLFVAKLHQIGFNDLTVEQNGQSCDLFSEHNSELQIIPLEQVDADEARGIVIESFANLGEIDVLAHRNCPELKVEYKHQTSAVFDSFWQDFVKGGLSFGPSMEVATLPPLVAPLFVMTVAGENKLLEQVRSSNVLPQSIMHNYLSAVKPDVPSEWRVSIMYFIERHVLETASAKQFQAVLAANASSVTRQICEYVLKYDFNLVIHANQQYDLADTLLFPHALDQIMTISMKLLT